MQLNEMSKRYGFVHEQEPANKLCEALKYLAREKYNAVQTNEITITAGAATLRRSRKSQHHDSDAMHAQTSARHTTTTLTSTATQQLQTASECHKGRTCRAATRR
jgi:hypothetical protein